MFLLRNSRQFSKIAGGSGRLNGKVAVITGGGAGIGRESALLFAREGAKGIVIADWNEKAGNDVVNEIGDRAIFVKTDVSNPEHVQNLFGTAEDAFGNVEIVFNNAGIMHVKFKCFF
jgi:NAD(P)-dependent dehydrogenase (short-subunit alcohol dehydrogenase family)